MVAILNVFPYGGHFKFFPTGPPFKIISHGGTILNYFPRGHSHLVCFVSHGVDGAAISVGEFFPRGCSHLASFDSRKLSYMYTL